MKRIFLKQPLTDKDDPTPSAPSASANSGRTSDGKFAVGNSHSRGNPHQQQVQRLRSAVYRALTPSDLVAIVRALVARARRGDPTASKLLFERSLGKGVDVDRQIETNEDFNPDDRFI
jgi:hypothetical protein